MTSTFIIIFNMKNIDDRNSTHVVCPVIDTIDTETLEYQGGSDFHVGGIIWRQCATHSMKWYTSTRSNELLWLWLVNTDHVNINQYFTGFNWGLTFTWHSVPEHENKRRGHSWVENSALNEKYFDIPGSSLQSHNGRRSIQYRQTFLWETRGLRSWLWYLGWEWSD